MTTRSGSDGIGAEVLIQRAPQGMVRPKRKNARARMKITRTSRPKTLARSRERYRAFQSASCSRASGTGFGAGCWPEFTTSFYAWQLIHIALLRVVVETKTQGQIGGVIFRRQGSKRIRRGDSTPGGAIERHIARHSGDLHACNLAIRQDGKLNGNFAAFEQWSTRRFRDQGVPISAHGIDHTREIGSEVHALGVTQDLEVSQRTRPAARPRPVIAAATAVRASTTMLGNRASGLRRKIARRLHHLREVNLAATLVWHWKPGIRLRCGRLHLRHLLRWVRLLAA